MCINLPRPLYYIVVTPVAGQSRMLSKSQGFFFRSSLIEIFARHLPKNVDEDHNCTSFLVASYVTLSRKLSPVDKGHKWRISIFNPPWFSRFLIFGKNSAAMTKQLPSGRARLDIPQFPFSLGKLTIMFQFKTRRTLYTKPPVM